MQSSEDPNPQPLQHIPLRAIPEEGFRTPAEATDEDLVGGGNRFGEDDLAGDSEVDALTNNGQGPPSITGRLRRRQRTCGRRSSRACGAQAFRSQLLRTAGRSHLRRLSVDPSPDAHRGRGCSE